jgi:hypothetical protein
VQQSLYYSLNHSKGLIEVLASQYSGAAGDRIPVRYKNAPNVRILASYSWKAFKVTPSEIPIVAIELHKLCKGADHLPGNFQLFYFEFHSVSLSDLDRQSAIMAPEPDSGNKASSKTESKDSTKEQNSKQTENITFAGQDRLPKLPIPDLDISCKNYLRVLKPLQSRREHEETKAVVEEFVKHEGPELQERLKKYAGGRSSYIEQFCKSSQSKSQASG